ncbi:hypothetical protein GQF61_09080 [Sphingobacterium sp. DK4209]|uniref:Uncharacterized protein n=1 Tax=Sphingobacterium zhuxiongii TaxID=2662364 RepID=A0A5Q0QE47_9SPHI|nr:MULTISPECIES: hypothetical protein [unclassified Sphingobacterium]MVZ66011.1 hypothetical protein [Sphingobacterium sp. DK4209]QGA27534.1 hypothetical protein GFH32_14955 [Sphingobacterium sp. dk4302]
MKSILKISGEKLLLAILVSLTYILCFSCKRTDLQDEKKDLQYLVDLDFSGFDYRKSTLDNAGPGDGFSNRTGARTTTDEYPVTLFYWSFDKSSLESDVYPITPGLTYLFKSGVKYQFVPGFESGLLFDKSLEATSLSSIQFKLSTKGIKSFSKLKFDLGLNEFSGSSIRLHYSFGFKFEKFPLGSEVSFPMSQLNLKKNTLEIDLSEINFTNQDSIIFIVYPNLGYHDKNPKYSEEKSIIRFDNIKVTGIRLVGNEKLKNDLHYYVFDAGSSRLRRKGQFNILNQQSGIRLELPVGEYHIATLFNNTLSEPALIGDIKDKREFLLKDSMGAEGRIFSSLDTLEVSQTFKKEITLSRAYSQIRLEFTDVVKPFEVRYLRIYKDHQSSYWNPFAVLISESTAKEEQPYIIPFNFDKQDYVVFNEFLGLISADKELRYRVEVWGEERLIRTFKVKGVCRNNMQLAFRGDLLSSVMGSGGFLVNIRDRWDKETVVDFVEPISTNLGE